jgi:hypothetical protein
MKRICVFCGASRGNRPEFAEAAAGFGRALAARGLGLVYGGTGIGLMGLLADAVLAGGGEAIGVLPRGLEKRELAHRGLSELHFVETLAERKQLMFDRADAFVALPGGLGTLDELGEALTWAQLKLHDKPLGLLNTAGYFDSLLAFLRHGVAEGLVRAEHLALLQVADTPEALLEAMLAGRPARAGLAAGG